MNTARCMQKFLNIPYRRNFRGFIFTVFMMWGAEAWHMINCGTWANTERNIDPVANFSLAWHFFTKNRRPSILVGMVAFHHLLMLFVLTPGGSCSGDNRDPPGAGEHLEGRLQVTSSLLLIFVVYAFALLARTKMQTFHHTKIPHYNYGVSYHRLPSLLCGGISRFSVSFPSLAFLITQPHCPCLGLGGPWLG